MRSINQLSWGNKQNIDEDGIEWYVPGRAMVQIRIVAQGLEEGETAAPKLGQDPRPDRAAGSLYWTSKPDLSYLKCVRSERVIVFQREGENGCAHSVGHRKSNTHKRDIGCSPSRLLQPSQDREFANGY